jgi:hypothetical protein
VNSIDVAITLGDHPDWRLALPQEKRAFLVVARDFVGTKEDLVKAFSWFDKGWMTSTVAGFDSVRLKNLGSGWI